MYLVVLLPLLAAALVVLALVLKRSSSASARKQVPPRVAYTVLGTVLGLGLFFGLVLGFTPPWRQGQTSGTSAGYELMLGGGTVPEPGSYPTQPLEAGDRAPPLEARGWLNGEPPVPGAPGSGVILLDLWASWCPGVRETAPGLVRAYHKFKERGVTFVSLTNMPEASAEEFTAGLAVPWPSGYGAANETIARFGAFAPGAPPGYQVTPTLYVIGPDGLIRWCDRRARTRHQPPEPLLTELDHELEEALAAAATGK
jgi:hypothetical protein